MPTIVTVRVIAKGGKFVSSEVGGVAITFRDVETGELLASGAVEGTSGDSQAIMADPRVRAAPIPTDEDAASFTAVLKLREPRLLEVRAYGPLAQRQSAIAVTTQIWLIPGKDVTAGDALLLELPGLAVDVLSPATHAQIALTGGAAAVTIEASVMMMCGCPIEEGGFWPASSFEIWAELTKDGLPVAQSPLTYAGTPSRFSTTIGFQKAGIYEATVYAYQPANGNTGLDKAAFTITPP